MTPLATQETEQLRATIRILEDELASTNQEVLALTLELEKRVEDRTSELRLAQQELERANYDLLALTAELESRVAQRTQELAEANESLRRTQDAMLQQERLRALGQMASGIAHDINNAISPVALYTDSLLESEPSLTPNVRKYLETSRLAIGDVAHTIARMAAFYRHREPQTKLEPVNLNPLVDQVLDLTRARWKDEPERRGTKIEVRTALADSLPELVGSQSEIRDALTNLVFNAVDAMPQGGALTLHTGVRAGEGKGRVMVEVRDSGIGMDEQTRRRCLEPFFTTKGDRGTGLGLAMVYGMAQRHGAEVEIDSTPSQGTCVRLVFPAAIQAQHEQPGAVTRPARKLRVLVIDDDPLLLRSLRDTLEADGHQITTAPGGAAGIESFTIAQDSGEPFELVVTDLGMPHVDGRQVASAIKSAAPAIPVILLTGWGHRLSAEGDIPPQVDRLLNKPPKLRELRAALADLADR